MFDCTEKWAISYTFSFKLQSALAKLTLVENDLMKIFISVVPLLQIYQYDFFYSILASTRGITNHLSCSSSFNLQYNTNDFPHRHGQRIRQ